MRTGAAHDGQCASKSLQYICIPDTHSLVHVYIVCADDTVNQVVEVLLPTLKELQGTVNTVSNDLNRFNVIVNNLTEKVSNLEEHQNTLSSKMDQLESKLDSIKKKKFKAVESQLEEHMTQTTSELHYRTCSM